MRQSARVTAGEPELHCWCPTCQLPTRVRVPLHIGSPSGPPAGLLEICPGCGTGHDRPSVTAADAPRERRRPLVQLAHAVHGRACRRRARPATGCAHDTCPWPGLHRNQHTMAGDDGTWTFLFCTRRHMRAWADQHHFTLQ